MACYHPLAGYQASPGSPLSFGDCPARGSRHVVVPCGQCHGCRLDRAASMGVRCMHEASLYEWNQFVTLTYKDNPVTLIPEDLTLFLKRLRHVQPFRFYGCGEYGAKFGRPHYHLLLFNFPCMDRYYWRMSDSGFRLYRSPALESVWRYGNVEVGDVSFESAAYCARYAMKKAYDYDSDKGDVREILNVETGEIYKRAHEFSRMSLKPGIGAGWYEKYKSDVYPFGKVSFRGGASIKAPKYYDNKYKLTDPDAYVKLSEDRKAAADLRFEDNSPARLRVKEVVERAKCLFLEREL